MKKLSYTMTERLFIYPGEIASWHFLPISKKIGVEIKKKYAGLRRGFGSVPVEVLIGQMTWKTSIFPDKSSGSYLLPIKAQVRKVEGLHAGDQVTFTVTLLK